MPSEATFVPEPELSQDETHFQGPPPNVAMDGSVAPLHAGRSDVDVQHAREKRFVSMVTGNGAVTLVPLDGVEAGRPMLDGPGVDTAKPAGHALPLGPVPFAHTRASVLLDLLRGLAAVLVLLDHWRNMLFVDYPMLTQPHWMVAAIPYLLTSAGHQAVVVFFVLSGYLVGGSVFRSLDRGRWSWKEYLLHRLVRLWIVLLPGLLLCVAWDLLGMHLHRAPSLYEGAVANHLTSAVSPRLSLEIFFGNLFFVGGLHVPTLGSDGALWSLAFEFWYYLLFPLALLVLRPQTSWASRAMMAVALAACGAVAGWGVLLSFPIWLLGAWLARARLPQPGRFVAQGILVGYPLLFFGTIKLHLLPGLWQDYGLGLATAALLLVMLGKTERADAGRFGNRFARSLASFSFTLYVAHLPLLLLLTSLLAGDRRWQPGWHSLGLGAAVLAVTVAYSYCLAVLTEFRTDAVRRVIEAGMKNRVKWFTRSVPARRWRGGMSASVRDTVQ